MTCEETVLGMPNVWRVYGRAVRLITKSAVVAAAAVGQFWQVVQTMEFVKRAVWEFVRRAALDVVQVAGKWHASSSGHRDRATLVLERQRMCLRSEICAMPRCASGLQETRRVS